MDKVQFLVLINEYEWINECAAQPPSLQFPTVIPLGHEPTTVNSPVVCLIW